MDLIERQAAIDAVELTTWYHQSRNGEMVKGANSQEHQAWYKAEDVYKVLNDLPSAQPEIKAEQVKEFCEERGWIVLTKEEYHWLKSCMKIPD